MFRAPVYENTPSDEQLIGEGGPKIRYPEIGADVLMDYGTERPDCFPFDMYEAYRTRLMSFINGALYAIQHDPSLDDATKQKRIESVQALAKQKNEQLDRFKEATQGQKVTFSSELYKFYNEELPKASGFKPKQIALGEAFYVWQERHRRSRSTKYRRDLGGGRYLVIEQIETPQDSPLTAKQKKELLRIHKRNPPKWFKKLEPWAQSALKEIVPTELTNDFKWLAYQRCRPAVLRHIPGEANATRHQLRITSVAPGVDGKPVYTVISDTTMRRQGVPTSFNMSDSSERQTSATENVAQMLDSERKEANEAYFKAWGIDPSASLKCPVFLGGLVTPRSQGGVKAFFQDTLRLTGGENNTKLASEKDKAVEAYKLKQHPDNPFEFFNINVSVNGDRSGISTAKPDANFVMFVEHFSLNMALLGKSADKNERLSKLNRALAQLTALPHKTELKGRNQNLYLAALYDVTTRLMSGLSTGNCKSSKDRKGVATLMADAMLIYYAEKVARGETPSFPAPDAVGPERDHFVEIFCELYASGHQLLVAHDNGPGCAGIKDEKILDKDIIAKLESMQRKAKAEAKPEDVLGVDESKKIQKTTSNVDTRGIYTKSKEVANFNKPGTFWQKYKDKIVKGALIGLGLILGGVSVGLLGTGVLAPIGIATGFAATSIVYAAALGIGVGVGVGSIGLGTKELLQRKQDKKNSFDSQMSLEMVSLEKSSAKKPVKEKRKNGGSYADMQRKDSKLRPTQPSINTDLVEPLLSQHVESPSSSANPNLVVPPPVTNGRNNSNNSNNSNNNNSPRY